MQLVQQRRDVVTAHSSVDATCISILNQFFLTTQQYGVLILACLTAGGYCSPCGKKRTAGLVRWQFWLSVILQALECMALRRVHMAATEVYWNELSESYK